MADTNGFTPPPGMEVVYQYPRSLSPIQTHYCPGCTHGVAHRIVAEAIDELNLHDNTILVAPVGCSVFAYHYFELDACVAAHGRAPAMATGLKRVNPEKIVITYQGDGDLASIGTAEIIHAAARGENITTIFINNAIYGMTGGQMAPTSLPGQKTTTSRAGRDVELTGLPIRMSEVLAQLPGASYVVRRSLHDVKLKAQINGLGFSMVELLSSCPTNWGLSPSQSLEWIEHHMVPYYPIGDFKVADAVAALERSRKVRN
jgi:2-oxoglutarate ferredoxin oxidoreductase subunit beta